MFSNSLFLESVNPNSDRCLLIHNLYKIVKAICECTYNSLEKVIIIDQMTEQFDKFLSRDQEQPIKLLSEILFTEVTQYLCCQ